MVVDMLNQFDWKSVNQSYNTFLAPNYKETARHDFEKLCPMLVIYRSSCQKFCLTVLTFQMTTMAMPGSIWKIFIGRLTFKVKFNLNQGRRRNAGLGNPGLPLYKLCWLHESE